MFDRRRLARLLLLHYGIDPTAIEPGDRGTVAETFVVDTVGDRYFVKLVPRSRYADGIAAALPIHLGLAEHGIDQIGRPIPALAGQLSVGLDRHVLVVLAFIDGTWTETYPFDDFVELIARVHETRVDVRGDRESFTDSNLATYERRLDNLLAGRFRDPDKRELQASLRAREPLLRARAETFRALMRSLQRLRDVPMVLTHHDAPGNVLLGADGRIRLVDWDDLMWAPRERDTWHHLLTPPPAEQFLVSYRRFVPGYVPDQRFVAFYLHGWYFEELDYFMEHVLDPRSTSAHRDEVMDWFRNRMDWLEEGLRVREEARDGPGMTYPPAEGI